MPKVQAFLDLNEAEMRRVETLAAFAGRTQQELFDGCLARGLLVVEQEYHDLCVKAHLPGSQASMDAWDESNLDNPHRGDFRGDEPYEDDIPF